MLIAHLTLSDFFPLINIFIILPICILVFSFSIKMNLLTREMPTLIKKKYLWLTNIFDYLIISLLIILTSIITDTKEITEEFSLNILIILLFLSLFLYLNFSSIKIIFIKIEIENKRKFLLKILLYPLISIGIFVILLNLKCYGK